jgi:hypothetical protein
VRSGLGSALDLYEWNSAVSSAVLRDLAHFEIALRNAYDRAITRRWKGSTHWLLDPQLRLFGPLWRSRGRRRVDVNDKPRRSIQEAVRRCGPAAPPEKVVAELSFGFWRYITSSAHEKSLWVPFLHTAYPPGTSRKDVDRSVSRLNELRNRVAHHEPIFSQPLGSAMQDLIYVCTAVQRRRSLRPGHQQRRTATQAASLTAAAPIGLDIAANSLLTCPSG